MRLAILCFVLMIGIPGCQCGHDRAADAGLDEMGLLPPPPVEYQLRVEGSAASVRVNESVEIVVCETFSEDCHLPDLPTPLPRLRHHEDKVDLLPYLLPGENQVDVARRPNGEGDPLTVSVTRASGRKEEVLFRREIGPSEATISFQLEVPMDCRHPALPTEEWLLQFLDPLPEALRTWDDDGYSRMLLPARTEQERENRTKQLVAMRSHPLLGQELPSDALRQDHRSAPLALNYSCEAKRLFIHPADGGWLVAFVGTKGESLRAVSVELAYANGEWHLASF